MDRNTLKVQMRMRRFLVVPYVGTWIEITSALPAPQKGPGRSLRGNVDRNFDGGKWNVFRSQVVPYVGTWIEIKTLS